MKIKNGYRTLREGKGKKIREKGNGKWERAAQGPVAVVSGQKRVTPLTQGKGKWERGKVRDEGLRRGRWQWTVVSGQWTEKRNGYRK